MKRDGGPVFLAPANLVTIPLVLLSHWLSRLVAFDLGLESDGCRDSYQREAGMGLGGRLEIADRFAAYVGALTKVIGHADRERPLRDYCSGLLATEGRRSVEPMAAVTAPARVSAQHQKLLHFVANARWSDEQMLAKVRELVVPSMPVLHPSLSAEPATEFMMQ